MIAHNKPTLGREELKAVKEVLDSNWLISGERVEKLEAKFKKYTGRKYAIAVNSGLSALHLSLIALSLKRGDEIIIPSYTCVALLYAIDYVGAKPVIIDIEENGFNIDQIQVKKNLSNKTKAIIVPHTFGFPARIKEIKKFNIPVIEDCAQAIGGSYKGKPLGSYGDIGIFSFYASKMLAAGQGGMMVTNNKKCYETAHDLINYSQRKDYKIRYNYQLTDLSASVGNAQFSKLNSFISRRRKIARKYQKVLDKKNSVNYWPKKVDFEYNHYRFILEFKDEKAKDAASISFKQKGILTIPPLQNFETLHVLMNFDRKQFPNTEKRSKTTLSIPVYPALNDFEVKRITTALKNLLE